MGQGVAWGQAHGSLKFLASRCKIAFLQSLLSALKRNLLSGLCRSSPLRNSTAESKQEREDEESNSGKFSRHNERRFYSRSSRDLIAIITKQVYIHVET